MVGHELGHLIGRDPLILFGIAATEFILRVTVLLSIFLLSPILYLLVVFWLIFFVAKFFEARADLLSAMVIGQPQVLARSLSKIGVQSLAHERTSSQRLSSWFQWDTHPPIYYRIQRLNSMTPPIEVKHPLIRSVHDVLSGFRRSF